MDHNKLELAISFDAGKDMPEELYSQLTRQVYNNIADTGSDSVKWRPIEDAPEDAKGLPVDLNTILVSVTSASVLTAIIQLVKDWVLRSEGRKVRVKTQVGEGSIEFEYSPTATSEEKLTKFAEQLVKLLHESEAKRV
jgi:hypothetical protein